MLYKTFSAAVYGIDASIIEVEVDVSGIKTTTITSTRLAFPTLRCVKAGIASARHSETADTTFLLLTLR